MKLEPTSYFDDYSALPHRRAHCRIVISVNMAWNIYNFRRGLIRALIENGCEVIAVAPPDACVEPLRELGCRYVPITVDNKGTNPVRDFKLFREYVRVFRELKPDVICFYTVKPNIYGSLAARTIGIPVVNTISGLGTPFIEGGTLAKVVMGLYRVALSQSRVVFFQNEVDRDFFVSKRLVRASQTRTVPGSGVDLAYFNDTRSIDRQPERPADAFTFLLIARVLYDKGIKEYVEAARQIRATYPGAKFQLLGSLDAENPTAVPRKQVEDWVSEEAIEYIDPVSDVRPLISQASCIVLPSYREGTSKTLLEAAAMGKPIITTDVVGCREVVSDGDNGLLCQAKDADDLARKIKRFIELPAETRIAMGKAGRRKIEQEFDERIVINRYLTAFEEIMQDSTAQQTSGTKVAVASH